MIGFYWATGGGAGDVWFNALEDKRLSLLPGLVEDYNYRIRIYSVCHCPGTEDLFRFQPHVHEVVTEDWQLPSVEEVRRFSNPIGQFVPLRADTVAHYAGPVIKQAPFTFRYSAEELARAEELLAQRPVICLQPYSGLSDRDGFDPERLGQLCDRLVSWDPNCRVLVLGRNHERGHKYQHEECPFVHSRVVNLIDCLSLRMSLLLVSRCDAYAGGHSNLIRAAWRWRRRSACVMPAPSLTDALPGLDPQYTFGLGFPENRIFTYEFTNGSPRRFETLDVDGLARYLLGQ